MGKKVFKSRSIIVGGELIENLSTQNDDDDDDDGNDES